jgi:hypothetical protein
MQQLEAEWREQEEHFRELTRSPIVEAERKEAQQRDAELRDMYQRDHDLSAGAMAEAAFKEAQEQDAELRDKVQRDRELSGVATAERMIKEAEEQRLLALGYRRVSRRTRGSTAGTLSSPPMTPEPVSGSRPPQQPHKRRRGHQPGVRLNTKADFMAALSTFVEEERRVPKQWEIAERMPHPVTAATIGAYAKAFFDGGWEAARRYCKELLRTTSTRTPRPRD